MRKIACTVILIFLSIQVGYSDQTARDFSGYKSYAKTLQGSPQIAASALHPKAWFKGYTPDPKEASEFPGVMASQKDLTAKAIEKMGHDPAGETVFTTRKTRPHFTINMNSPAIIAAKLIESDSHHITSGISDDKVNCEQRSPNCHTTTETKQCETPHPLTSRCTRTLHIEIKNNIHPAPYTISATIPGGSQRDLHHVLLVQKKSGQITGVHLSAQSYPFLFLENSSVTINGVVVGKLNGTRIAFNKMKLTLNATHLSIPYDQGMVTVDVQSAGGDFVASLTGSLALIANNVVPTPTEQWTDQCQGVTPPCPATTRCTDPDSTKTISGFSIHKACWQYQTTYHCGGAFSGPCQSLRDKGCQQIGSLCLHKTGGYCDNFRDSYQCAVKTCPLIPVCGKPTFCRNGDCTAHKATQNTHFGKAASELAAVSDAADDFKKGQDPNVKIFVGHRMTCHRRPGDSINCCSNHGWGIDINLLHCSQGEKDLGAAKEKYLTTYLGTYCAHRVKHTHWCTNHLQVSCVWPSKMARIMQEQGRLGELHISMGGADSANCRGISVDEMQRFDLSKINFKNPRSPYPSGGATMAAGITSDLQPQFTPKAAAGAAVEKGIADDIAKGLPTHGGASI